VIVARALPFGRRAALWPIALYQRWLSPLKRMPTCRFAPTCSSYAAEAIVRRGVVVGLALTLWRIVRCNPLCAGGFDPVPPGRSATACAHGAGED
jgi:putative membrane protein insertion efficiency factor